MVIAGSRGRSTVATAKSIVIPYSWNAVMRTLGHVPIQFTIVKGLARGQHQQKGESP